MKQIICIVLVLLGLSVSAQNTTIKTNTVNARDAVKAHKVMIIPFEPKLYMSEIDRAINTETGMSAKEIKYKFRNGINEQLFKAFKTAQYNVLDLMDDTVKYRKDLEGIYQYLTYQFMKVPNQENYKAPEREKEDKKLQKGQLTVETNSDARFMNAKLTNAKVVPLMYGKYKTDVFIFINQLDIKMAGNTGDAYSNGTEHRKITVHYTVYTYDAKEINSGIAEEDLPMDVNNPKKIIDKYFSKIAGTILLRVNKGLGVPVK